jgi:aspartate carbamoyltransferase catalytic subunit
MSEPAKDEAELISTLSYEIGTRTARAALAAIRAAGWAVVPVALMDQLVEKHEELCDEYYYDRKKYADVKRRYEDDMKTASAIRAMLAAAPGLKP